ncbi:MAG: DMT family transporter [Gammaproteobacteria bacterium]|nr:DMT family transporter [Gammaproteobacteria bacterium]
MRLQQKKFLATLSLIITTAIWGSTFIVAKKCLPGVRAIPLVGYRFFIAALIIGIALIILRKNPFTKMKDGFILGMLLFFSYITQTVGLYVVSAADSGFISGLVVVFVPIFSVLWGKEKLSLGLIFAVILTCAGIWGITGGIAEFDSGELVTLLSAIIFALYVIFAERFVKNHDIWILNFQQFLVIGLFATLFVVIFRVPFAITSRYAAWGVVYLGVFASLIAFILQLSAQKVVSATFCSILLSLELVFAAGFAWTLGGEKFTRGDVVGGILIMAAIIFAQISEMKKVKNGEHHE